MTKYRRDCFRLYFSESLGYLLWRQRDPAPVGLYPFVAVVYGVCPSSLLFYTVVFVIVYPHDLIAVLRVVENVLYLFYCIKMVSSTFFFFLVLIIKSSVLFFSFTHI